MDYSQYFKECQKSVDSIKMQLSSIHEGLASLAKQFSSIDVSAMIKSTTDSLRDIAYSASAVKFDFSQLRAEIVAAQKVIADSYYIALRKNPTKASIEAPESVEEARSTIQTVEEIVRVQNTNTSNKLKASDIIAIIGILLTLLMWAIDKVTDSANKDENQTVINNYYYVVRDASVILEEVNEQLEITSDDVL